MINSAAMFVNADLQAIFYTEPVLKFMICLHTKFHIAGSAGLLDVRCHQTGN
jgi:hypothetical protein